MSTGEDSLDDLDGKSGFYDKPNTVPTPDEFFDIDLKECSAPEIVVLAFVIRKTLGYGKLSDVISLHQIDEGTSISIRTIQRAIESLRQAKRLNTEYVCSSCGETTVEIMKCKEGKRVGYLYKCSSCGNRVPPNVRFSLNIGDNLEEHLSKTVKNGSKYKGKAGGIVTVTVPQKETESDEQIPQKEEGGIVTVTRRYSQSDHRGYSHSDQYKKQYIRNKKETTTASTSDNSIIPEKAAAKISHEDVTKIQKAIQEHYSLPYIPSYPACKRVLADNLNRGLNGKVGLEYVIEVLDGMPPLLKSGDPVNPLWSYCRNMPKWDAERKRESGREEPVSAKEKDFKVAITQFGVYLKSGGKSKMGVAALKSCLALCATYGKELEEAIGYSAAQLQEALNIILDKGG